MIRIIFIFFGCIALILGTIGIFLPGLPTTPLVLLASWCFYKGSPKMREWLLNSFFGNYIRDYERKGGMTKGKKVLVITLMVTMVLISAFFLITNPIVRYVVLAAGAIGCIVVIFFVPNAKDN